MGFTSLNQSANPSPISSFCIQNDEIGEGLVMQLVKKPVFNTIT
jgi:hypothetical protein